MALGSRDTLMSTGLTNGHIPHSASSYRQSSIGSANSRKISNESTEVISLSLLIYFSILNKSYFRVIACTV